jgi:hypothetical protein
MRAGDRLAAPALVLALSIASVVGSAFVSRADPAPEAAQLEEPATREPAAQTERAQRPRGRRGPGGFTREQWWTHAREVLLSDLALSEDQRVQVDAIIEAQVAARKRAEEIQAELIVARRQDDTRRSAALRTELRASRSQLKDPFVRIEQIRRLLTEPQRPTFDMNRARLVAEQQEREQRKRRRARRARSGADAQAKTE